MGNRNQGGSGGGAPLRLTGGATPLRLDRTPVVRLGREHEAAPRIVAPPRNAAPLRLDAAVTLDGPGLRHVREARGLSLADLAARTKLTLHQLDAIEAMRRDGLPSPAYLRGFLRTMATAVGVDPEHAVRDYLDALAAR